MKILKHIYSELFSSSEGELTHYFNSLFDLLLFVDNSSVENKQFYSDVIISRISTQELLIIFYFLICEEKHTINAMIEKYSFFKNLPKKLIKCKLDFEFFEKKAFGSY